MTSEKTKIILIFVAAIVCHAIALFLTVKYGTQL